MATQLLGPLEMTGPEGRVRIGGSKERLVLALLVLRAGEVVSRDALVDALWGDDPPATSVKTMQGYVARVRKSLHAAGMPGVLTTRAPGYVLDASSHATDVESFEAHASAGHAALVDGDASRARTELSQGLELWRGEALADCRGGGWARTEALRLDELRLATVEDRVDADLMLGHHGVLVGELQSLVATYPMRERLWAALMLALYRSGRQGDSVRAYQRAREVLVAELGLEPGAQLRRLESAVLVGDPSLDTPLLAGRAAELAIPLPDLVRAASTTVFVGRAQERERLNESLKAVAAGERRVVLVSGEPGIGKTALSAAFAREAFDNGACVLFGRCEEDLATPYQLFSEALGHYVTHASEDDLAAHVALHRSELVRLVPALASRIPDLPPSKATDKDTERFLLFAAAVGLLVMASAHRPVVLVFDDLHWADGASLLLLRHLIASEQPLRVLIIGTYRHGELPQASALRETLGLLRRSEGVSRIELTGLDDTGVLTFLEAAAGHALEGTAVGLAQAVCRETDGNPFFVSEVLRHLSETGAVSQDAAGRWVTGDGLDVMALPDSVREVIGGRVARLGPDAERVLSMAAVIGRDFDLDVLAHATQTSEDDLLDVLDAAAVVSLVREVTDAHGRYSFAHALIQHTLYKDLGPNRRARAHRQVAGALEDLCGVRPGPRAGELARHWCSAQPIDLAKAVSYSRLAADAALAALAPADALGYYAQALDHVGRSEDSDPVVGVDLAIGLGTAQRQTGNPAFRDTLLDAAHGAADLGDVERLAAAALANYRGWHTSAGAVDADKVEILEMALARLPADRPERALVLATLCSELVSGSPLERRQALADEAIAIAESSGDDPMMVRVLNQVFVSLFVPSQLERSWGRTADALVRAERVGDPVLLFFAAWWRAEVAGRGGDVDEMDRCYAISGSLADQLDQPTLNWANTFTRSMRAQIAGDPDQIEQLAKEALRIGTDSGQPDATIHFGGSLAQARWQRGTLGEVAHRIELTVAGTPSAPTHSLLAMAYVEGDRLDDAARVLEEFALTDFDLPLDSRWLIRMVEYAEAAIECRASKYAAPLLDRLAPWADQLATAAGAVAEGPVSHYLGGLATVLGRYDEADAHFTQAAAMSKRMSATFFAARTHLLWGRMLAERTAAGETEKARDLLIEAHTTAAAHGYATVARRAAEARHLLD